VLRCALPHPRRSLAWRKEYRWKKKKNNSSQAHPFITQSRRGPAFGRDLPSGRISHAFSPEAQIKLMQNLVRSVRHGLDDICARHGDIQSTCTMYHHHPRPATPLGAPRDTTSSCCCCLCPFRHNDTTLIRKKPLRHHPQQDLWFSAGNEGHRAAASATPDAKRQVDATLSGVVDVWAFLESHQRNVNTYLVVTCQHAAATWIILPAGVVYNSEQL
jgi:hypothetical protein